MRYHLWIHEKIEGPFEPVEIADKMIGGFINDTTLARPEDGSKDWDAAINFLEISHTPPSLGRKPSTPKSQPQSQPEAITAPPQIPDSKFKLPPVEESGAANILIVISAFEAFGSVILGFIVGADNPVQGVILAVAGLISAAIIWGFAEIIRCVHNSAQRIYRIELLIQKGVREPR